MILRRYGTTMESVDANFDSKAFTEVGFRRNHAYSCPADDFLDRHERVSANLLEAEAEGDVQDEVESAMLGKLLDHLESVESGAAEGEVVLIESAKGADYPKTRTQQKNVVVEGENRLYFYSNVSPPLKVAVFKAR